MQHPTEWPIWHDDGRHDRQGQGAVTPGRHDIALAAYLERQEAWRASTVGGPLFDAMVRAGRSAFGQLRRGICWAGRTVGPAGDVEGLGEKG
ncbi:hypothetical protein FJ987_29670 [Mesorhizobium sp. CU2]|uniref:hypothetical protein n=1 Tax=unclassified Mesorhizobium TaxID=325217 RepID=UPI001126259A|nr:MULTISPECIES: hypothetical protein [unclassified Mesorhizobium]TPN76711.1 hypothetical protein FJ988_27560 [Mesorhizobium sp. CU3]TPO01762.1 hypothetical protein FJ987_29670 [Mesorhizobium sp. CU2]